MERRLKPERLLAENIRTLLDARRLDQTALAVWCGHDTPWLSKILTGSRNVKIRDLGKIADFFGLTVAELFQPGISSLTERRRRNRRQRERRARERRAQLDRRRIQEQLPPHVDTLLLPERTDGEPTSEGA